MGMVGEAALITAWISRNMDRVRPVRMSSLGLLWEMVRAPWAPKLPRVTPVIRAVRC